MRDRLTELLPLVIVGVVLVVFQLSRQGTVALPFQSLPEPAPTAAIEVAAQQVAAVPRRTAIPTPGALVVALCNPAQPRFRDGLAALKTVLGSSMGEPLECEHPVSDSGDTQQKTTTGLAYYRKQLNLACFTTGWDHWSLVQGGLVHWSGGAVDPPIDAVVLTR